MELNDKRRVLVPSEIVSNAQTSRVVIEDFKPLADSLEWSLGQRYLRERGSLAFLSDPRPVPYAINNDGNMSLHAAEVFFRSLTAEDERSAEKVDDIYVLELGIGLGLFARLFLDAFRNLCVQHNKNYYDRLVYVAADHSEKMLLDVVRRGTFANHPGRYLLRVVDAFTPNKLLHADSFQTPAVQRPFRAVFLNYVLDCLSPSILRANENGGVDELFVRLCLSRGVTLGEFTDLNHEQLVGLGKQDDPSAQGQLLELFGSFSSEYKYFPFDSRRVPFGEFALNYARTQKGNVMFNHGAMQSLVHLLELLADEGFILINDYGYVESNPDDDVAHQRFSNTTAVGLNFAMLEAYFHGQCRHRWITPAQDSDRIYSRILCRTVHPDAESCFKEYFAKPKWEWLDEPARKAKQMASQMRYESAAAAYRTALERQANNWQLLAEVASFLNYALQDPRAGLDLARSGLRLNPFCSAELWNAAGDCLFALRRMDEAKSAYERALLVNPSDVAARYSLACVYFNRKEHSEALRLIAEGLSRDWRGEYREGLLQKQAEVLADVSRRSRQEYQAGGGDPNLFRCVRNGPTNAIDPNGTAVYTLGGGASFVFVVGGGLSVFYAWDDCGNYGWFLGVNPQTGLGANVAAEFGAYTGDLRQFSNGLTVNLPGATLGPVSITPQVGIEGSGSGVLIGAGASGGVTAGFTASALINDLPHDMDQPCLPTSTARAVQSQTTVGGLEDVIVKASEVTVPGPLCPSNLTSTPEAVKQQEKPGFLDTLIYWGHMQLK